MNPTGTVVVGVDGSPESRAAIEFAMREAMRRQAWLRVVAAAQLPEYWTIAYGTADLPSPEEVIADTKRVARQTARRGRQRSSRARRRRVQHRGHRGTARPGARRRVRGRRSARAGPPRPWSRAQRPARIGRAALRAARDLPGHHRPARRRRRADPGRGAGLRSTAMRHTTVADVMSTNVISAGPQDSFAQLATLLHDAAIRAVPVVDDDARCWGRLRGRPHGRGRPPRRRDARRWWRPRTSAAWPGVEGGRDHSGRAHDHRRADRDTCRHGCPRPPAR